MEPSISTDLKHDGKFVTRLRLNRRPHQILGTNAQLMRGTGGVLVKIWLPKVPSHAKTSSLTSTLC